MQNKNNNHNHSNSSFSSMRSEASSTLSHGLIFGIQHAQGPVMHRVNTQYALHFTDIVKPAKIKTSKFSDGLHQALLTHASYIITNNESAHQIEHRGHKGHDGQHQHHKGHQGYNRAKSPRSSLK